MCNQNEISSYLKRPDTISPIDSILRAYEDRSDVASIQRSSFGFKKMSIDPTIPSHRTTEGPQVLFGEPPVSLAGDHLPQHQARQLASHNSKPWLANRLPNKRPSEGAFRDGASIASARSLDYPARTNHGSSSAVFSRPATKSSSRRLQRGSQFGPRRMTGPFEDFASHVDDSRVADPLPVHQRSEGNLRQRQHRRYHQAPPLGPNGYLQHPERRPTAAVAAERRYLYREYDSSLLSRSPSLTSSILTSAWPNQQQGNHMRSPNPVSRPSRSSTLEEPVNISYPVLQHISSLRGRQIKNSSPPTVYQNKFWDYSEGYMDVLDAYANDSSSAKSRNTSRPVTGTEEVRPIAPVSTNVYNRTQSLRKLTEKSKSEVDTKELESPSPIPSPRAVQARLSFWTKDPDSCLPSQKAMEFENDKVANGSNPPLGRRRSADQNRTAEELYRDFHSVTRRLVQEISEKKKHVDSMVPQENNETVLRPSTAPELVSTKGKTRLEVEPSPDMIKLTRSNTACSGSIMKRHEAHMRPVRIVREENLRDADQSSSHSLDERLAGQDGMPNLFMNSSALNNSNFETGAATKERDSLDDLANDMLDLQIQGPLGTLRERIELEQSQLSVDAEKGFLNTNLHKKSALGVSSPRVNRSYNIQTQDGAPATLSDFVGVRPDSETLPKANNGRLPPSLKQAPLQYSPFKDHDFRSPKHGVPVRSSSRRAPDLSDVTEESTIASRERLERKKKTCRHERVPDHLILPDEDLMIYDHGYEELPDNAHDLRYERRRPLGIQLHKSAEDSSHSRVSHEQSCLFKKVNGETYDWQDTLTDPDDEKFGRARQHEPFVASQRPKLKFGIKKMAQLKKWPGSRMRRFEAPSPPLGPSSMLPGCSQAPLSQLNVDPVTGSNGNGITNSTKIVPQKRSNVEKVRQRSPPQIRIIPPTPELLTGRTQLMDSLNGDAPGFVREPISLRQRVLRSRFVRGLKSSTEQLRRMYAPSDQQRLLHDDVHEAVDRAARKRSQTGVTHRLRYWMQRQTTRSNLRRRNKSHAVEEVVSEGNEVHVTDDVDEMEWTGDEI